MNENQLTHMNLSRALIAGVLDFPAVLDAPEIARIQSSDLYPGFGEALTKIRELQRVNNLSIATLTSALSDQFFTIPYFNTLRAEYRDTSFEDLQGISKSLRGHAQKRELVEFAKSLHAQAQNGHNAEDIAREAIKQLTPIALSQGHTFTPLSESLSVIYDEITARAANPSDIWGIPYKYYPRLSKITGGKQKGELIIFAGEPKVGKSWWAIQDAMGTALDGIPTGMWCGEMKKKQIARRMLQLQGLDGRRSKTGYMEQADWDALNTGVEALEGIPFYQDDKSLHINDVRPILTQLKNEYGVEHVVLDYAYLIGASGKDETERTAVVSREIKSVVTDLDLSCILITSVSKMGMDTSGANSVKSNIRGSGQQIHDADMILMLTKFAPVSDDPNDMTIKPNQYDQYATLHISAGRELDSHVPGGCIHYRRFETPKFDEVKG
jgi:replicative DNA helicase